MTKIGRNDPCPCGSGKKYKTCCGQAAEALPIPDHTTMEQQLSALQKLVEGREFESDVELDDYLRQVTEEGGIALSTPRTLLDEAQELIYDAWETQGKRKRIRMAWDALRISLDCADAYSLLAEEAAETLDQACDLYRKAVQAGESALGPKVFAEDAGCFWGLIETRPYMRARAGLAQTLALLGEEEAAIEHYREMLRLNPNDNQGIRYYLLSLLMTRNDIDAAEKLLTEYGDEPSPQWLYTWALVTFLRQGDGAKARKWLKKAVKQNPHVLPYLLGKRRLPRSLPDSVLVGGEDEAASYVTEFRDVWSRVPGAKKWVESQTTGAA